MKQAHAFEPSGPANLHSHIVDELAFLAEWEGGLITSLGAYLRVRQLHRAHPSLVRSRKSATQQTASLPAEPSAVVTQSRMVPAKQKPARPRR